MLFLATIASVAVVLVVVLVVVVVWSGGVLEADIVGSVYGHVGLSFRSDFSGRAFPHKIYRHLR